MKSSIKDTIKYTVEKKTETVTWINVTNKNAKGETFVIELIECENPNCKESLPVLWKKHGFIDRVLDTYLCIHTYCTDSEGMCRGAYNPQTKLSDDGKRHVINFDWMFENTEENKQKLINEAIRLFESATGKSATEIKLEKIYAFAKEHNLDVYESIPEGYEEFNAMTYPSGCTRIVKGKKFFRDKNGKLALNPNYKEDYIEAILIY